jgi:hypothetical protein
VGERAVIAEPLLPRIDTMHSAAAVAGALVDLFEAVARLPAKVSWVQQATERQLAHDADPALAAAARAIANAIDAEAASHDRQAYHSRQHFCEAMLAASVLCQLHRLASRSAQLLLVSALIHDVGHDGKPNLDFRLERGSIARATPYLVAAGVGAETRQRLAALVLATEPHHGVRAARRAQDFHAGGVVAPRRAGDPQELLALEADAELSHLAVLLCEADVLPSVGLTSDHAMRLQDLLAKEWGRHLGPRDKLAFIDDVLSAGVIGPFFRPNVSAIRRELAWRVDGPR